jgi:hypothetical protein
MNIPLVARLCRVTTIHKSSCCFHQFARGQEKYKLLAKSERLSGFHQAIT